MTPEQSPELRAALSIVETWPHLVPHGQELVGAARYLAKAVRHLTQQNAEKDEKWKKQYALTCTYIHSSCELHESLGNLVDAVNIEFQGGTADIGGKTGPALIDACNKLALHNYPAKVHDGVLALKQRAERAEAALAEANAARETAEKENSRLVEEHDLAIRDAGLYKVTLNRAASALGCEAHTVDIAVDQLRESDAAKAEEIGRLRTALEKIAGNEADVNRDQADGIAIAALFAQPGAQGESPQKKPPTQ